MQTALEIHRERGDRVREGATLSSVGVVYAVQGRYAEALENYLAALEIQREVGHRTGEGNTLTGIGVVYREQGRDAEALENYQAALEIHREVGNRAMEGVVLSTIGTIYTNQGRYAEALNSLQAALEIHRGVGNRASEGVTLFEIGQVYRTLGRFAEALNSLQAALEIHREVGYQAGEGETLTGIGVLYQAQGRYAEALERYQGALIIRREVGDRIGVGITLNNIGLVYAEQDRPTEALERYEQAMNIFEELRAVAGSEEARASFISQYVNLYDRAIALLHQQGQDKESFFTTERGRARTFLDSLATGQVQLSDNEAAGLFAIEQEAYTQRQSIQDNLAKARALNPPDPDLVADLEAQLAEAEQVYIEALAAIETRGGQLADLVPGRGTQNVLGVSEVQALLDEDTTLLSFYILEEQTLIFVITRNNFEVITTEVSRQELNHRVGYFRDVISKRQLEAMRPAAQELYQLLIAPVAASLHSPRLAIVPHGPLHYLPFAALIDPDTNQYLIEHYELVTLPSASALTFIQQNARKQESGGAEDLALVLGNPTTGDYDATASLAVERAGLSPLPFAEQEAEAIAALYGVEPLLRENATESAVREQVTGIGVLHLAAHGLFSDKAPLNSLIALAPDSSNPQSTIENPQSTDGWLTVGEIYGLDLSQTELIVLSACQTQLGELSAGDEVVGLTRAFFFAGTPTVMATLWNVDDEATSLLMERFYTHLREGKGKAAALRQAQLEMIADYPDPYYWAGFVLSGDGGEVSQGAEELGRRGEVTSSSSWPSWLWVVIAGGGVLLVAVLIGGVLLWRQAARRSS